jgi:AsmA protein
MKKKKFIIIAGIVALIIIGLIVVPFIIDVNTYKPKAEAVLSDSLGIDVKIQGDMHIALLPDFSVSLKDVSLRAKDADLCIIKKAKVDLELSSLIRDEINILEIDLIAPTCNIVRNKDGILNFEKPGKPSSPSSINLPYIEKFSISKGDVIYLDEKNEDKVMATGIDIALADVSVDKNAGKTLIQTISLDGTVKAEQMKSEEYEISNIDLRVKARKGVFELLSVSKSDIVFLDEKSDDKVTVNGLDFALENVSIDESGGKDLIKKLSFDGDLNIERFEEENYKISDLSFRTKARKGVFVLNAISTSKLHGKEDDKVTIDLTGKIPAFTIQYNESGLPVEEMLRRLSQEEVLEGEIDLEINLSMKGASLAEIKPTLNGEVSFQGENLIFHGLDIDDVISKFERSQEFDLLDMGSTFFLGPIGPVITKGSDFAQVYSALQKEKDSEIQKLICSWDIKNGVAEATDVALATKKHRIAMVGKLDFVNEQFLDVTIAVLDSKGCAVVSQEMHGSFSNPEINTMNTIQALMGPVMGVLDNTTKMLLMKKCKVFYKGSLEHPEVKKKDLL